MAGLLGDSFDDPRTGAVLQAAMGLLGGGSNAQRFAVAGATYAEMMQRERAKKLKEDEIRQQMAAREQLMQQQRAQAEEAAAERQKRQGTEQAYRGAIRSPEQQAMSLYGGPTNDAARVAPGMAPQVDQQALIAELMKVDPVAAFQMLQPKPKKLTTVAPGASVIDENDPTKPLFTAPAAGPKNPASVQEYEYAKAQGYGGTYEQWELSRRRAGATNVSVNTEKPMLNAMAQGLGKQIDDSLAVARSAVPAIQTAQTLRAAAESGKVVAGPGASFRVLGLQVGQMMGVGGKDGAEILANTRTAIQSMAQAELSAAQQMKGQGQITEAERAIIKRAAAGDINELTAPEIGLLANVMEKTARYKIEQHKRNVQGLAKMPGAEPLMPFYQVDEPAPYKAPNAVRRYNPATGKIE